MKSLQRFPGLQARILAQIDTSLDDYRKKSRDFAVNLVKMEGSLIIPQLFKMADESFGEDKRDMGPDAEWAMARPPASCAAAPCTRPCLTDASLERSAHPAVLDIRIARLTTAASDHS
jgi:hypothetical protein